MNERPKHEVLRLLGAFMGGLGVLLAGIAILILAIRPPLCPVKSSECQATDEPPSPESVERQGEEMQRLAEYLRTQMASDKLPPEKVEVKTELQPVP